MSVSDRTLLNETATTGGDVVVRVDLSNFDPVRGQITLNLTANRTLVAQRTVTVGIDAQRTVYLQTAFQTPGRYAVGVNGVGVGSVTVTVAATGTPSVTPTASPATVSGTPVPTPTEGPASADPFEPSSPSATPVTETSAAGPAVPTGIDTIVGLGLSFLLLYGVGVVVYVLQE